MEKLISSIKVRERHRKDMGDIPAFAASIQELGCLLQPIVVTKDGRLVAGHRRLQAFKYLDRKTISRNRDRPCQDRAG
jgi:ParB family transcriptional regulator, chromosome partitioning protein